MIFMFYMCAEPTQYGAIPLGNDTVPYFIHSGGNKVSTAFCHNWHVGRRNATVKKLRRESWGVACELVYL